MTLGTRVGPELTSRESEGCVHIETLWIFWYRVESGD